MLNELMKYDFLFPFMPYGKRAPFQQCLFSNNLPPYRGQLVRILLCSNELIEIPR